MATIRIIMGLSLDGRDTLLIPSILIRLFVDVEHIKAAATAFPGRPASRYRQPLHSSELYDSYFHKVGPYGGDRATTDRHLSTKVRIVDDLF
ncbi:hypothetical protein F9C07_11678 [Aspergillus flavus]|uniref:Uncharacterized protein n=1 Tax=Aspergillus flavus (strain ATCC 200026 / FGSC A1120 / IAM 13836 / NRRL 3357 / JCM 12722 / SRRC 167) TaxID=332952 RepID=A0A7U2N3X6_ASPFN|nr:hypothetical protein F9C07_11678 [Aspergillus flavus]